MADEEQDMASCENLIQLLIELSSSPPSFQTAREFFPAVLFFYWTFIGYNQSNSSSSWLKSEQKISTFREKLNELRDETVQLFSSKCKVLNRKTFSTTKCYSKERKKESIKRKVRLIHHVMSRLLATVAASLSVDAPSLSGILGKMLSIIARTEATPALSLLSHHRRFLMKPIDKKCSEIEQWRPDSTKI